MFRWGNGRVGGISWSCLTHTVPHSLVRKGMTTSSYRPNSRYLFSGSFNRISRQCRYIVRICPDRTGRPAAHHPDPDQPAGGWPLMETGHSASCRRRCRGGGHRVQMEDDSGGKSWTSVQQCGHHAEETSQQEVINRAIPRYVYHWFIVIDWLYFECIG
jgi:hypothetical protein